MVYVEMLKSFWPWKQFSHTSASLKRERYGNHLRGFFFSPAGHFWSEAQSCLDIVGRGHDIKTNISVNFSPTVCLTLPSFQLYLAISGVEPPTAEKNRLAI